MKLVVNAYMSILIEGVAEALEPADRLGIGYGQLEDVIEGCPLDAPIADAKLHKMDAGDFAAEFPLQWALKDVDLAIRPLTEMTYRCSRRCPPSGISPWTRGTDAKTSAPPASFSADSPNATANRSCSKWEGAFRWRRRG